MKQLAILTLLLVAGAPALAQSSGNVGASSTPTSSDADRAAIAYLTMDSIAEVDLGRLATEKSQNAAVRAFARRMIADHTTAINEATAFAKSHGYTAIEHRPSDEGIIERNHLARYSGRDFDVEYLQIAREGHLTDAETIRHASEIASSGAVRSFESAQLAVIEQHLLLVERTMDRIAQSE